MNAQNQKNPLKIGLIGAGSMSKESHIPGFQKQKNVEIITEKILDAKKQNKLENVEVQKLEKKLDNEIYKIYGLTEDEQKFIEAD